MPTVAMIVIDSLHLHESSRESLLLGKALKEAALPQATAGLAGGKLEGKGRRGERERG